MLLPFAALPLLALLALADREWSPAVAFLLLPLLAGWFLVRAARRSLRAYGSSDLDALRAQDRRLVAGADASRRAAEPAGSGDVRPCRPTGSRPAWPTAWHRYLELSVVVPLAAGLALVAAGLLHG